MMKMHNLIDCLSATSRYQRERVSEQEELLYSDTERFSLIRLTTASDKRLSQAVQLLSGTFEEEMDDTSRIVREWVVDPLVAYQVLCAGERVIAASNCNYLSVGAGDSILAVWYVAVNQAFRGRRLVHELYHSMYEFFADTSLSLRTNPKAIVGEASHGNLETINRVLQRPEIARKLVYYVDSFGKVAEVPYVSPPLHWNRDGTTAEHAEPNHLMIKLVNHEERMPVVDLFAIIRAIYADSYTPRAQDFADTDSFMKARVAVDEHLRSIETALSTAQKGEVFLR